jgi:mono/diheme cytochrome c family protein
MALSADHGTLFVADPDNGALARVNLATGDIESVLLGMEPTRIARIGDLLYVTLRAERAVAVVQILAGGDVELRSIHPIGAEPYGIVASPDGSRLYVALSTENVIVEVDPATMTVTGRHAIPGEPRWLALHPEGHYLFIGTARGGVWRIDLREGEAQQIRLPRHARGVDDTGEVVDLTPRVTGDLVVSPQGDTIAIPVLYVDNHSSAGPADPLADGGGPIEDGVSSQSSGGYSSERVEGMTRFNPAVVTIGLKGNGEPNESDVHAVLVSGVAAVDAFVPQPTDGSFDGERFDTGSFRDFGGRADGTRQTRGYLTSLAFHPSGNFLAATIEGGRAVAFLPTRPVQSNVPQEQPTDDLFGGDGAFEGAPRVLIGTDDGPAAVLFLDDGRAVSWSFMGRSIARIDARAVEQAIAQQTNEFAFTTTWSAELVWSLGPSILPPDVQEGRRLFYSSSEDSMAFAGAGVSCATCHFEGRNDGLTWTFDQGVRQTPSLAGPVSMTSPVTWTNAVDSVGREVEITSQGRMGGAGISHGQLADVAAYIDWSRDVDVPLRGSSDAAIARGKAVFERADTACSTCHSGERGTDNKFYDMFGLRGVNTPGLVGIDASGPYLHDGSAATLRDVLLRADEGGMGSTKNLTPQELQDLETYLRSR